jgi:hypothetical protein
MMQWNKEVLLIQDHKNSKCNYTTTKDAFTQFVRRELDELETFIRKKVLFGISLESIGISCQLTDSMDTGDTITPGYGPFLSAEDTTLDNVDSNKFLRALTELGKESPVRKVGGNLVWDKTKSNKWSMICHMALQTAYCLVHTTPGLAGRASEEVLIQWTNEEFGACGNIRISHGTVAIDTSYHKGALFTGMHKNIVRLLPYRLARILYILLRVVRPVELMPTLRFCVPVGAENAKAAVKLYRTRVFVSWGKAWTSALLSRILKAWFKKGLNIPMGIRMYRHFATCLQRRYIRYIKHAHPEDIQEAADGQAGRTVQTSEGNYAIERKAQNAVKRIRDFEMVSAYWHEMCELETYPPDDD